MKKLVKWCNRITYLFIFSFCILSFFVRIPTEYWFTFLLWIIVVDRMEEDLKR